MYKLIKKKGYFGKKLKFKKTIIDLKSSAKKILILAGILLLYAKTNARDMKTYDPTTYTDIVKKSLYYNYNEKHTLGYSCTTLTNKSAKELFEIGIYNVKDELPREGYMEYESMDRFFPSFVRLGLGINARKDNDYMFENNYEHDVILDKIDYPVGINFKKIKYGNIKLGTGVAFQIKNKIYLFLNYNYKIGGKNFLRIDKKILADVDDNKKPAEEIFFKDGVARETQEYRTGFQIKIKDYLFGMESSHFGHTTVTTNDEGGSYGKHIVQFLKSYKKLDLTDFFYKFFISGKVGFIDKTAIGYDTKERQAIVLIKNGGYSSEVRMEQAKGNYFLKETIKYIFNMSFGKKGVRKIGLTVGYRGTYLVGWTDVKEKKFNVGVFIRFGGIYIRNMQGVIKITKYPGF